MPAQIGASSPPVLQPSYVSIKDWCQMSGMSRTSTYRALASRDLKGVKMHTRTLIDYQQGLRYINSLPAYRPR